MKIKIACTKSSLMKLELKTYQGVKQLWTKWAKFKRYVKEWKEEGGFFITLPSHYPCLPSFPANHKKKWKTKTKKTFPHNGVRSWLAYLESLRFQIFSLFFICRDLTRCTTKSIRSWEDKKKTFPFCFWFFAIAQVARQRAYVAREGNSSRQ